MRVLACTIGVAVALAGAPVRAAEEPAAGPAAPADDELAAAKELHLEADAKYNTADYDGALKAWQRAFAALPRTPDANPYRSLIQYNIAATYEKLFELRGDVEYLKQAKKNLESYEASIDETYAGAPEEGEAERVRVKEKIAHIDALIAAGPPPKPPPVTEPEPTEPKPTEPKPTDAPPKQEGRGLVIGGGVLIGLGIAGGAGMTAALVIGAQANDLDSIDDDDLAKREDAFDRGRAANAGAIAAGVVGGLCLAAGIALVVVGSKRKGPRTALLPIIGRGLAGISIGRRF